MHSFILPSFQEGFEKVDKRKKKKKEEAVEWKYMTVKIIALK